MAQMGDDNSDSASSVSSSDSDDGTVAPRRKVAFKDAAAKPPSVPRRYQPERRPASVPLTRKHETEEIDDEQLTDGFKNLSLRSKSASPAVLRRLSSPSQSQKLHQNKEAAFIPIVHIPANGQYGLGKICLQMPDLLRSGLTKTLSLSYSTSAINHNSRLMADDFDMAANKRREQAQSMLVRRIENRLLTLKLNKEAFLRAKAAEEKERREEENKLDVIKKADHLLKRRKSEAFMTVAEKKQARKERIRARTGLLNYRTANYLRKFDAKHFTKMKSEVRYSRNVELDPK